MLDPLFSLQFVWISLVVILLSTGIAYTCVYLHHQFLYVNLGDWLTEHIYCPVLKVLLLMLMAFLMFPLIIQSMTYSELFKLLTKPDFLINMVNILFLSSLLFSFLPVLSHPGVGMPLLGCIATALIFLHKIVLEQQLDISWLPSFNASIKIIIIIVITYLINRWLTRHVSEWVDHRFIVSDSKVLVADINHLIFQMPVVLAYGHSLKLQTIAPT